MRGPGGVSNLATTRRRNDAADAHERFLFTKQATCIDCHKGIAHRLPNMEGVPRWQ